MLAPHAVHSHFLVGWTDLSEPTKPADEVTTEDIFAAAHLNSYSAFYKWVRRGILMAPIGKVSRGVLGVHLVWGPGALEQARWFAMMRQRGKNGRQLLALLEGRACDDAREPPAKKKKSPTKKSPTKKSPTKPPTKKPAKRA